MQMENLYKSYGPMVYRRCLAIVKEEDVAKDLTQDVFVKILEGDLANSVSSSYLYTTATHLSLNHLRNHKKFNRDEDVVSQLLDLDDVEAKVVNKNWLASLFKRQKADSKTIAYLHWVDGFTLDEVAESVGMSVSGVRKRLREIKTSGQLLLQLEGE